MKTRWVVRTAYEIVEIGQHLHGRMNGKPHTLTLEAFKRPRTNDQNAKLHAMIRDLAIHTGHAESDIKEYLKDEFGFHKSIEIGGKERSIPKGSSEWSVEECSMMIERLYQIGAECGCTYQKD